MPNAALIHLIAMSLVFAFWAFLMFRMLWRLTRRSLDKQAKTGGGYFTWVGHSLRSFGEAATSAQDGPMRRQLLWVTLAMIALIALYPLTVGLAR
ncbi:hypothetical protein EI983_15730 [Roseovarius faecimaris]|uniref:Uncharacterized protein n=1 Tax=Roseovarius faecimaris TaxID=2494550 RepID=A0A6I6IVX0_9RHOB|nr:hypothetical protein [Roseovarius faecimaris]QGX99637.1 hypothetical protein EI983_15730 [Roseovarius faecimaris]